MSNLSSSNNEIIKNVFAEYSFEINEDNFVKAVCCQLIKGFFR